MKTKILPCLHLTKCAVLHLGGRRLAVLMYWNLYRRMHTRDEVAHEGSRVCAVTANDKR